MTTQTALPGTKLTLLEQVRAEIKALDDEAQDMEEAFTKAENKYRERLGRVHRRRELLRRCELELTNR